MLLKVNLRTRVSFLGNQEIVYKEKTFPVANTACLLIGLWSSHSCLVAEEKLNEISQKVQQFISEYRPHGMKVIVGSSSMVNKPEYKLYREPLKNIPFYKLDDIGMNYPPLPFNVSHDGGIVELNPNFKRTNVDLNNHIKLVQGDVISGNEKEIINYLHHHKIELVLVAGVHLNLCVIDRPYAIKNLRRYNAPVCLIRDLTDPMCNAIGAKRDQLTSTIVEYVEQYLCPSTTMNEIFRYDKGKIIYVDVDKTLCHGSYENPSPNKKMIDSINLLYDQGYTIVIWTARGCVSGKDYFEMTLKQLSDWNVKFHSFKIGKPEYDYFICDKTINPLGQLEIS